MTSVSALLQIVCDLETDWPSGPVRIKPRDSLRL